MMKKISRSFVAWSFAATLASFVTLYFLMPYEKFLYLALAIAFGICLSATYRYGKDALTAFRSGKTGGEFLIVAVFAIVSVLLGQRAWSILLTVLDRPDWLVNSPVTILVPWLLSWAISLALIAPDLDVEHPDARASIWKSIAIFIGGALVGIVVSTAFASDAKQAAVIGRTGYPTCRPGDVIGTGHKTYHTAESRYRMIVVPRRCFSSDGEAKAAGYAMVK